MKPTLLATLEYPPHVGGIARYLANIVACAPAGSMTVLAPQTEQAHVHDMGCDAPIYRETMLWKSFKPGWLPSLMAVDKVCRAERPAAILVSHVLPMGHVVRYAKMRYGIPYVVMLHGMDIALAMSSPRKRAAARAILKGADRVVVNSEFTGRFASALDVPAEKIMVIRPTPSWPPYLAVKKTAVRDFRQRFGLGKSFTVSSVGRLVARKGFDIGIEAVARLRARGYDVKYFIVGEGPERVRLGCLAKNLKVADSVVFAGSVPAEELSLAYAASDVFAMVPRALGPDIEGFGTVYLEAGLLGKPVIGSRSGGVPEAVLHAKTGILVEPGQSGALADAIAIFHDFPELARKFGEAGRLRARGEFNPKVQTRPLFEYLKSLG